MEFCQRAGSRATTVSEIVARRDEAVYRAIDEGIQRVNRRAAARPHHIQKWAIVHKDFSIAGGELGRGSLLVLSAWGCGGGRGRAWGCLVGASPAVPPVKEGVKPSCISVHKPQQSGAAPAGLGVGSAVARWGVCATGRVGTASSRKHPPAH